MRIRPRCFVVMPYGRKVVDASHAASGNRANEAEVDFDAVYDRLLVPALIRAGCSWFRSSEESTSADVRTGMFYELATADFVLSDISILNVNVFYELGVRHGLSKRGSLLVHGGWSDQPIDIAVDRSFRYDGQLFRTDQKTEEADLRKTIAYEVERLARSLSAAVRDDPRHVSSPVYKELRGLDPPDAIRIDIERVGFANQWYRGWAEKVETAQNRGAADDIMTLAGDAASSLQAAEVFYTAAWALIGLHRFDFAEELLRAAVKADPGHVEAQCQLGLVLNRRKRPRQAAEYLNRVRNNKDHESLNWLGALGRVYKDMWQDTWDEKTDVESRCAASVENQALAYEALDLYEQRLNADPNSHYAAINICAITTWLNHAATRSNRTLDRDDLVGLCEKSKDVVRRVGETDKGGTGDRGYWACTSLAELDLCEGELADAKKKYLRAARWPGRGKYDLRSMLSHLKVYKSLEWKPDVKEIVEALETIDEEKFAGRKFNKVALCLSQMTDDADDVGDLPEEQEDRLKERFTETLRAWGFRDARVDEADEEEQEERKSLAICRGVRGAEIVFAELCADWKLEVRLLVPLPEDDFIGQCVYARGNTGWQSRYTSLIARDNVDVRFQDVELGTAPPTSSAMVRGVLWCLNSARVGAEKVDDLHLLIVRPDNLQESPSGFRAALDDMLRMPAIRVDIDPLQAEGKN